MITWAEIVIISLTILILIMYHVHLAYKVRTSPLTTATGVTNQLRRDWVQTIMEEKRDILAVQTLRNWVMAASFLASTAILISLGIMGTAFRLDKIAETSHSINILGATNETLWLIKLMVLIVDFFFAFFNFTLTRRIRVKVPIGIAYRENIQTAREAILATIKNDNRILDTPAHSVIVTGLENSSVNLEMGFWSEDPLMNYSLLWEYTEPSKKALDEAGIEIPFPHSQIFIERSEGLMELTKALSNT